MSESHYKIIEKLLPDIRYKSPLEWYREDKRISASLVLAELQVFLGDKGVLNEIENHAVTHHRKQTMLLMESKNPHAFLELYGQVIEELDLANATEPAVVKLTCNFRSAEFQAARTMLEYCGLKFLVKIGDEYLRNNGGKGGLVCLAPDNTPIGGLFDLADWTRKQGLQPI